MKKGAMKENIDQMRFTLAGTGIAAYAARWRIAGTLLSVGSGLLGFEDFNDKVARFALCFKCENLEWYNVRSISKGRLTLFNRYDDHLLRF